MVHLYFAMIATSSLSDVVDAARPTVDVQVNIPPMQRIGSLKMGLVCLPAGPVRWRDIARESTQEIADKIGNAVTEDKATFGRARGIAKISLDVVAIDVKLCVAWKGVGNAAKGSGVMTVRWSRIEAASPDRLFRTEYKVALKFAGRDPRYDPSVVTDALIESARTFLNEKR